MSMNSLAFALATSLGPVLGGLFTTYIGWEYCFFINIPLGIVSIILCWKFIPKTPRFKEPKLDIWGACFVIIGLIQVILGCTLIPPDKHLTSVGITCVITGLLTLVAFVFWELNHPFAILPKKLLTNK